MERRPNEEQRKVIEDLDNDLILFASAGTGKTFTVAKRVSQIIQTKRAKPEQILCLTFTTKACDEMREDVARYVGQAADEVEIRTIHGFCYQLMREESRQKGARYLDAIVCDEVDAEELLKSILASQYALWEYGKSDVGEDDLPDTQFDIFQKEGKLRNFVSALKHVREEQGFYTENETDDYQKAFDFYAKHHVEAYLQAISISVKGRTHVYDQAFENAMKKHAGRLLFAYHDYLRQSNRVDYDDLILFACNALKNAETRARWAARYAYIIVDEMQDTSLLEYKVLKQLFGKNRVMMCGDFFQSIYGWRGANPQYVLEDFIQTRQAKIYMLSQNYRSTQTLTAASFGYLCATYPNLVGKYCPKDIVIGNKTEGDKILCMGFDNRREEAEQIYRYLRKCVAQGISACVIARSNFYVSMLARAFEDCNEGYPEEERLRFFTAEEDQQFYRNTIVKDVVSMIKLLLNQTDRISMERIAEKYVRLVGMKTIEGLRLQNRIGASIVSFLDEQTYLYKDPYHVLIEAFHKGDIIVYDTETTGLDLGKDEMVQLAAVRIDNKGNILQKFERMIVPTVPIGDGAYATHGFDIEYIQAHGGVTAREALCGFADFVKGGVLVGHNSFRFDAPLIKRQLKDSGLPPLDVQAEYDTLTIAKQFHAELPDFRLSTLCKKYGIVNEAAHNAYGDIVATGKVLTRIVQEDVIPTAMERQNVCAKHEEKFKKLYLFMTDLKNRMERESPYEILKAIVDGMRMELHCKTDSNRRALSELMGYFRRVTTEDAERFLRDFVENAELSGGRGDLLIAKENRIPLLTVHHAKGCEFDTVIVAGVDERNFPNFYAWGAQDGGEEKVFYVAISRAKKKLILTRAVYNGRERLKPSPYVEKIPENALWKNDRWDGIYE